MGANVCPCLGRGKENGGEAGKELVADGSGGDHQHGWSVKKNQRERMEDATDTTGNFFAVYDGHGGTEAVRFVKKELPKPLGKERDPNPCERLRQAFDKANKALSEHFQKKGESNSDYGYCHLALAPVLLFTRGFSWRWPILVIVARCAAEEAHLRS